MTPSPGIEPGPHRRVLKHCANPAPPPDSYHHLEIRAAGVHHISTFAALVESSTNQVDTERGIEW